MTLRQDELPVEVKALLAEGRKIEAIKLLRDIRGMGLKEAKDAVEGGPSDERGGVVQRGGNAGWLWMLVVLAVAFAWFKGWL